MVQSRNAMESFVQSVHRDYVGIAESGGVCIAAQKEAEGSIGTTFVEWDGLGGRWFVRGLAFQQDVENNNTTVYRIN